MGWASVAREFLEATVVAGKGTVRGAFKIGKGSVPYAREALGYAKTAGMGIGKYAINNPKSVIAAAIVGGAGYGYATADPLSTPYQRFERAAGFGLVGLGVGTATGRGMIKDTFKRIVGGGLKGAAEYLGADPVARFKGGFGPMATMAAVGGLYGALNENQTFAGGAARGALGYGFARMGLRNVAAGNYFGARTGIAAGGLYAAFSGASAGGMVAGAALGGGGVMLAKGLIRHPLITIGGLGSAAIIGGAGIEAAQTIRSQRGQYDLGADGNLTLGLHSLRHG